MPFDPTSDRLALRYIGDGRQISGVPARDLTENDLCRIAHRRSLAAVSQDVGQPLDRDNPDAGVITRPDPRKPDQALVQTVHDELIARGQFVPRGKPAKAIAATQEPAAVAPEPDKEV